VVTRTEDFVTARTDELEITHTDDPGVADTRRATLGASTQYGQTPKQQPIH